MRPVPERITKSWIDSLADTDLVDCEARLREQFAVLDRRHKLARGDRYELMRGPPDLITAWDRWSRMNRALQARALALPHRPGVAPD